jgi:hypothetical protein
MPIQRKTVRLGARMTVLRSVPFDHELAIATDIEAPLSDAATTAVPLVLRVFP